MFPPMPSRTIIHSDALAWLRETPAPEGSSVVTSLPDVSELELGFEAWRAWFIEATRQVAAWVPEQGVAIFYQSDIRRGSHWVDKGYLVMRGAEEAGATVLFHKIVCRRPAGTIAVGRPSYSHMIAVTRRAAGGAPLRPGPDVLPDAGEMPWSRAMGVTACRVACRFLIDEAEAMNSCLQTPANGMSYRPDSASRCFR